VAAGVAGFSGRAETGAWVRVLVGENPPLPKDGRLLVTGRFSF